MADPAAVGRAIMAQPKKAPPAFDTPLSETEQQLYADWLKNESERRGRDLSKDIEDYDLQGYWKSGAAKDTTTNGHMPDTFKKPNHPTFSVESQYHGAETPEGIAAGGKWEGDTVFVPGPTNLSVRSFTDLLKYFEAYEPGVKLRKEK
jgi:hypothetical protein